MLKKIFKYLFFVIIALACVGGAWVYHNFRDRHPGYSVNIDIKGSTPANIQTGFAALKITPDVPDTWTDLDNDYQFTDKDTYTDNNKNGKFDAHWMAGFQNLRPANGIHDDLWARAVVIDDGKTRMALVSLDVIGVGHHITVNIRKKLPADLGITYAIVCNTHNHEAPDVIGMWGKPYRNGVNKEWLEFVENQAVEAITKAAKNLRPSKLKFAQDLSGARHLVNDTRPPKVLDEGLYVMQAIDAQTDSTLGTLVCWGDHPETTWNKNLQLTSDFPHYLREGIEKGVYHNNKLIKKGLGGTTVYVSGCIGGLMTTDDGFVVKSIFDGKDYTEPSFAKAEAQGKELAVLVLKALEQNESVIDKTAISIKAKTFEVPLENTLYKLGVGLNVLDAGYSSWGNLRTEVASLTIGEAQFLLIPGEIYPEMVNGGIEKPAGGDFKDLPILEIPPLRSQMTGKYKWVIGLANDEIGYIIPKTQWDVEAPFTYTYKERPYGEINSVGAEAGPLVHKAAMGVLK
jgi:hypothetical protein